MRKPDAERIIDLKARAEALLKEAAILEEKEAKRIADANNTRYLFQGEHLDSVIPELATLKREQFKDLIKKTLLTPYAKKELAAILTPENLKSKGAAAHGKEQNSTNDPNATGNSATQESGDDDVATTQGTGTESED
jgi:hypothetical protein